MAVRASKKLRSEELLLTGFAATRLRMELDRVPLWRGDHVATRQLVEDFARYLYLPRIKETEVLLQSIRDGLGLLTWTKDSFAFAESYDDAAGRYRGLRCGQMVAVSLDDTTSLLVKPEVARKQTDMETAPASPGPTDGGETIEIEADVSSGVPDNVVRTVTENSRTFKFSSHGFEQE